MSDHRGFAHIPQGGGRVRMRLESTYIPSSALEERMAHLSLWTRPLPIPLHKINDHTT